MPRFSLPKLVAIALFLTGAAWAVPESAPAQDDAERERVIRQANQLFRQMRSQAYTARMTGCGGWDCNDATLHIQMPGKIRIAYDYNSVVIADGESLISYSGGDYEVNRTQLAEEPLSCLLAGELGGDVAVDSIEEIDRGPEAGAPRRVYRVEVGRGGERITLLFAKDRFRFMGWITGDFSVEIRDLRPARNPPADLFTPIPQPAAESSGSGATETQAAPQERRRRRRR